MQEEEESLFVEQPPHFAGCEDAGVESPIFGPQVVLTTRKCGNQPHCNNEGSFICRSCHLISYCSRSCKTAQESSHSVDCAGYIDVAEFELERRMPAWAPRTLYHDLQRRHYGAQNVQSPLPIITGLDPNVAADRDERRFDLMGDYPAINILNLSKNEGYHRKDPIDILFIEPDDLRDVIKTILDVPENVRAPIRVVLTDCRSAKTARNLILLLMAISSYDIDATAECAVALWYGAYIPKWCIPYIKEAIGPYFYGEGPPPPKYVDDDDDSDAEEVDVGAGFDRTWSFEKASLKARLTYHVWGSVKGILNACPCRDISDARNAQARAAAEEERFANIDYQDKLVLNYPPNWSIGKRRYQENMQLTPFGMQLTPENKLHGENGPPFLEPYGVDPLRGWDIAEVNKNWHVGRASNDIYGKAFYHVRDLFQHFILRCQRREIIFEVHPYSGHHVPERIQRKFDRIDTSTLADEDRAGVSNVVQAFAPMLKDPSVNPHATLLTLHPNVFTQIVDAFPCPECDPNRAERVQQAVELTLAERKLLDTYLPLRTSPGQGEYMDKVEWIFTSVGWKRRDAKWLFRDPTAAWELYKDIFDFEWVADKAGVAMKSKNTIVDEWVRRLKQTDQRDKNGFPTPAARFEFDAVMLTSMTNAYRYVEWQILPDDPKKNRKRQRQSPKKHESYHEHVGNQTLARLRAQGAHLERWMMTDNCENWTPY